MADPQTENGYIRFASELWEALCRTRIPGEARQVLDSIFRKTYGFNKKEDDISLSQLCDLTLLSKRHVCGAVEKLISMNIIAKKSNGRYGTYRIIKDYHSWKPLPKKAPGCRKEQQKGAELGEQGVLNMAHTIDTITKDKPIDIAPSKRKVRDVRVPSEVFQQWADSLEGDSYIQKICQDPRFSKEYVQSEFEKMVAWVEDKQSSPYASERAKSRKVKWDKFFYNWLVRNL